MSNNKKPSIYDNQGKTLVCFGSGSIQVGLAKDDIGQIMVYLSDVLRENVIGSDNDKWEEPAGRTVVLGFNKVASIEVLEDFLAKAKQYLNDPKSLD